MEEDKNMIESLSLVVPVYNEEENLEKLISDINNYFSDFDGDLEVIFVDDGSSDNSLKVISNQKNEYMRTVSHKENKGYGEALKTGFREADLDWIAYIDGDNQFKIESLDKLIEYSENYDLVAGKRKKRADDKSRIIIGETFNKLVKRYLHIDYEDVDCGIKLFKNDILDEVSLSTSRTVDAELLAKSESKGFNIQQVNVKHYEREEGESEASGILGVRITLIVITIKELKQIKSEVNS